MILNMGGGGVVPKVNLDATTITPGTENQVIESGTYLKGDLTIVGDADLIPENIPSDLNLFGVQGTRQPDYGSNVWNKYQHTPAVTVENPQCSFSGSYGSNKVSISNANFDLSKIENYVDFFDGFEGANPNISSTTCRLYKSGDSLIFNYGSSSPTVTAFDPISGKFTVSFEIKATTNANCSYTGTKNYSDEKKTLESFIVNDDSSAYPNGAVHTDGYYYELLSSISSANVMSLSDNALATVQSDYRETIVEEVSES